LLRDDQLAEEGMDEFRRMRRTRLLFVSVLPFLLVATVFVSIFIGTIGPIGPGEPELISFEDAIDAIIHKKGDWSFDLHAIFWSVRIPRAITGALVGASLACAGVAMQAVFRNPMADPYIVGVSSGASVGAVFAILVGFTGTLAIGEYVTPIMAFVTAMLTVSAVYALGMVRGRIYVNTLLLSGVAVAAFLGALVSFMIYLAGPGEAFHRIIFWLLGSLALSDWTSVVVMGIAFAVGAALILAFSHDLNALLLGEETAHNLGTDPEMLKTLMLVTSAIVTAAAVAFTGVIGFVGLIIPHMARLVVGADHRILVPASILTGAIFVVWADSLARSVIPGSELPLGIITALFGGPFFLYLLRRNRTGVIQ